ncbi:MAG: hypothetical protein AAFW65_07295 [Pseudomonadota bacterium]
MDRELILQWFAYVRPMYWPVLCLEIVKFYLWAWADAETHGVARQMIIAVNDHGRIRVKFIEDAPADADDWRLCLSGLSAVVSQLTAPSPFDLIEGPISDAVCTRRDLSQDRSSALGSDSRMANAEHLRPLLDPG